MRVESTDASERQRHRVEVQARALEDVLVRHGLPAEVRGGSTRARTTTFVVETAEHRFDRYVAAIEGHARAALRAHQIRVRRRQGNLLVEVDSAPAVHVNLLDMLAPSNRWPNGVVALGQAEDDRPLFLNLFAPGAAHLLLVGGAYAGKSFLLRSIALSLAMTHRQSDVQMAFVDAAGGDLHPLHYLPHAISSVADGAGESERLLRFLYREMAYRRAHGVERPAIVLFLDGLGGLLEFGGSRCAELVGRLLRHGAKRGIRIVASTRDIPTRSMSHALRAHVSTRLVGRVADKEGAVAASGVSGCRADCLLGRGDFLAVTGGSCTRFQAAHVDDYDLHLCLEKLHRRRSTPLLARPFDVRPQLSPGADVEERRFQFSFDGDRIAMCE